MILKYSTLIMPYIAEKLLLKLSIVEVAIDTIALGHQLSRCIDLSMYRYTRTVWMLLNMLKDHHDLW